MSKLQRDILMCLAAVVILWLLFFILVSVSSAQEDDRWFVLDKFSGLNLYLEKTQLEPNQAMYAKNIQFAKPGAISTLGGLKFSGSALGTGDILGMGFLIGRTPDDTNDIYIACDSTLQATSMKYVNFANVPAMYNTSGDYGTWSFYAGKDTVVDGTGKGRIAEIARAGWWAYGSRKISYISDNSHFKMSDTSGTTTTQYSPEVYPLIPSFTEDVSFVPIEIEGVQQILAVQAGMEPVLLRRMPTADGTSFGARYFGVADSGYIRSAGVSPGTGPACYINDPTKLGVYNEGDLFNSGYWLQLGYTYPQSDTSNWGRVWMIDSNTVFDTNQTTQFRIWFTPGDTINEDPSGGVPSWTDSLKGTSYQILSAPFLRTVVSNSTSPNARVVNGGRRFKLASGTISARATDQMPHVISLLKQSDTLLVVKSPDTIRNFYCWPDRVVGGLPVWKCKEDTTIVRNQNQGFGYPIRCIYKDATDTIVVWTSRRNVARSTSSFVTSDWEIRRATIPFASDAAVYKDRLYLAGDPTDPNFMCWSGMNQGGASYGGFPTENIMRLPSNGDVFVGFAYIYDWLVIFQKRHTWVLKGDIDDGGVLELALPDEGCIAKKSIVSMENVVLFLSDKGWRIFDGNTSRDFADEIKPGVQAIPRVEYSVNQAYKRKSAGAYDATTGNVWMVSPFGTSTSNSGSFIFNYVDKSFTYSDEIFGDNAKSVSWLDTLRLLFTSGDSLFMYGYTDSSWVDGVDGDSMQTQWSTGWLDMGAPYQEKKISEGVAHVMLSSPASSIGNTKFFVRMYRDFDSTAFYVDTTNVVGIYGGKHYEVETSVRLEPPADSSTVQWLRVEFAGSGLNLMDIRRLALRYTLGGDVIRDATKAIRP